MRRLRGAAASPGIASGPSVRLVVGLAAPDDAGHVEALAALAEFLSDDARRDALLRANDEVTVRALIEDWEKAALEDAPAPAGRKER